MAQDYARAVGERLRAIRKQRGLSLRAVEEGSDGHFKAIVVGSYERGDRAVKVTRLAELADFYGVPIADLLPGSRPSYRSAMGARIVIDLRRLRELPTEQAGPLARYAATIQSQREDYSGKVFTIRSQDLSSLAVIYDRTPRELIEQLIHWGVVPADTDLD